MASSVFDMQIAEEFAYGPWQCSIRRSEPAGYPGAKPQFYPTYKIGSRPTARQHGWHDAFGTIDECRAFLHKQADQYAFKLAKSRERGAARRAERRAAMIAKVTRDYLLGKHIGNLKNCACCNRALTDAVSIERGIGSECWPNLMDSLTHQAPHCEAEIARLQAYLATVCDITFEEWLQQKHYPVARVLEEPELRRMLTEEFHDKQRREIHSLELKLDDQRHLLVAARKWNEKLLTATDAQ